MKIVLINKKKINLYNKWYKLYFYFSKVETISLETNREDPDTTLLSIT